ncbi:serine-type endopeptidase [Mactra antiquata]
MFSVVFTSAQIISCLVSVILTQSSPGGIKVGQNVHTLFNPMEPGNTGPVLDGIYTSLVQVNIRCVNNPTTGLVCAAEYPDKCSEQWNFPNPCTPQNIDLNITKFVHPFDKTKFLMCGQLGKLYVVQCPQFEVFHEGCGQCVGESAGMTASCEVPLPPVVANPCTREAILANKLFFPFPRNLSMFIHCDIWGKPWERICTPGEVWSQWDVTCVLPHLSNPCNRPTTDLNYLYKHPCNPRMFLQCDSQGRAHEVTCGMNRAFNEAQQMCQPFNTFPPLSDFTPFCENYVFGFRTFHGNDGVPLPNATETISVNPAFVGGSSASVTGGLDATSAGTSSGTLSWEEIQRTMNARGLTGTDAALTNTVNTVNAVTAQTGAGQTWQDIRTQGGQGTTTGSGMLDAQPAGQTWQDIRTQGGQGTATGSGMLDAQTAGQTWQDIRTQGGQGTPTGSGALDTQTAGQTWLDIRTQGGQGTPTGSGALDTQGAAQTWQDVRTTATGNTAGFTDAWQDIRTPSGNAGTNVMVDIRGGANQAGVADASGTLTDPGSATTWQDVRSQPGNAGSNVLVDIRGGANQAGTVDTVSGQGSTTAWQDIRSQPNRNTGFIDATGSQSGSVAVNRQPPSSGNVPTLDLRNQMGLTVDATKTTTLDVSGTVTRPGGGRAVAGGNDQTMQQLLNTWNRIISSGGTASNNVAQQGQGADPMLTNTLADKSTTLGAHKVPPLGMGKPIHPSQLKMYEYSEIPFSEPCTQINLDAGRTHFRLKGDPHKFLQCGANGKMHKMPCSTVGRDWFDVYTNTCVDGPVHLPV